jgi:hypothetical protein
MIMPVEEIATLAAAGASALIGAMASDVWNSFRDAFARALGRGDPERVEIMYGRLEKSYSQLAPLGGRERERAALQQEAAWRTRIADLLEESPDMAARLRDILSGANQLKSDFRGDVVQRSAAFDRSQQAVQGRGRQVNTFYAERGEE